MQNHIDRKRQLMKMLTIAPFVAIFATLSVFTGFASAVLSPAKRIQATSVAFRVAQDDGESVAAVSDEGVPTSADALADYKAALALIKKSYYGKSFDAKESRKLAYEAARGMLASLRDPFTSFMDPEDWNQMQTTTRGDFEGIGAALLQEGTDIIVEEPFENSPADRAGIRPQDVITKVDGKTVIGKNINDVVKLIKGKGGTMVKVTIVRGKEEHTFNIKRGRIETPVVKHWMQDPSAKIGYIQLREFNEKSVEQLVLAFNNLKKQGMKALVFDLRGNPGGLLETAIQVSSMFVPRDTKPELRNTVVHIREGSGQENRRTLRSEYYLEGDIPLTLLVNDSSASASEIVSGAIKDYGVGTLIGERTFGKGRVQTLYPLLDDSALRLTTALYFPPKKYDINFKHDEEGARVPNTGGILPDIEVKQPENWKGFRDKVNDMQLQKATQFLRARLKGSSIAQATKEVQQKP